MQVFADIKRSIIVLKKNNYIDGGKVMLDFSDFNQLINKYSECKEIFNLQDNWENERAFQKLISLRSVIPKKLYAMCLYKLFVTDIDEVLVDTLIEAFSGIDREDIMFEEDLIKYNSFPEKITIYRGSQNPNEEKPRMSWSLLQNVANNFATAHMFKATISKEDVIAYFSQNGDEEEILAVVGDNFEKIY